MTEAAYGLKTRTDLSMEEAEEKVRELLSAEGFGILTEIDVAETLKEKLGLIRRPYRILGACNPQLAAEALDEEIDIGLLLPCNVVVYEDDEGTVVSILDPGTMVQATENPAVEHVATEARSRLERVASGMRETG